MHRIPLSNRAAATGAFAGMATFPAVVAGLGALRHDDYHPVRQAMSELALGRGGWLMTVAFCTMGVGTFLLALALRRSAGALVAPSLLALAGALDFVSAAFHTDPTGTATATAHGRIHDAAGIATFLLFVAAIWVCAFSFRRSPRWRAFAAPTAAWAAAAVATFFLIPALGDGRFGLAQRIFVATWLSWSLVVALRARRTATEGSHRRAASPLAAERT